MPHLSITRGLWDGFRLFTVNDGISKVISHNLKDLRIISKRCIHSQAKEIQNLKIRKKKARGSWVYLQDVCDGSPCYALKSDPVDFQDVEYGSRDGLVPVVTLTAIPTREKPSIWHHKIHAPVLHTEIHPIPECVIRFRC
jgi:hypothetical protein